MSKSTDPLVDTLSVDTHRTCRNCGTHVTKQTIRVFGVEGVLYHCPSCPSICARDLRQGAGKDPDYDPVEDRGDTSEHHPIFNGKGGDGQ
ncbi:hypothetical protein [Natrinema sp. DC36]|uniref:DUF7563 family protein n=1 Tax=Natrinema sp. DC36 TaxID=2878680 RepID=UPI001CEFF5F0|nr:hypothetical protein [Natrinema sp. DC36]